MPDQIKSTLDLPTPTLEVTAVVEEFPSKLDRFRMWLAVWLICIAAWLLDWRMVFAEELLEDE